MQTLQHLKWKTIVLLILSFTMLVTIRNSAGDDYLIVRVVDADYPPEASVFEHENWTGFTIPVHYQVENPTSSPITIPYLCGPYPFPYMRITLRDKSLRVIRDYYIEWVAGETTLQPGYRNGSYLIYFAVENYVNESLPLGTYKFWFDYTNCSLSPVPVITEKMYIDVTETSVTYCFDWNNTSRIVSPRITLEVNYYLTSFISTFFLVLLVKKCLYLKKKKVEHYNH